MSVGRDELEKLRGVLEEAMIKLNEATIILSRLLGEEVEEAPPSWMVRRLRVWRKIVDKGGVVTREELYETAKSVGMDKRGLGGFFTGKASLTETVEGKVAIRKWAADLVKKYRGWLEKNFPND